MVQWTWVHFLLTFYYAGLMFVSNLDLACCRTAPHREPLSTQFFTFIAFKCTWTPSIHLDVSCCLGSTEISALMPNCSKIPSFYWWYKQSKVCPYFVLIWNFICLFTNPGMFVVDTLWGAFGINRYSLGTIFLLIFLLFV